MKNPSKFLLITLIILSGFINGYAQKHTRIGFGLLPSENIAIFGFSLGLFSLDNPKVATIGSRIELIGPGFLTPLSPGYLEYDTEVSFEKSIRNQIRKGERVYGLDLALTGSVISGEVIGLSLGLIGDSKARMKGFMIHGIINNVQDFYGGQIMIHTKHDFNLGNVAV